MSWQTPPSPQVAAWRWRKRKQDNRMHELKWQIRQSVTTDSEHITLALPDLSHIREAIQRAYR